MMWGNGWGGWVAGALMMLIFWGGLAALVVFSVRAFGGRSPERRGERSSPRAQDILAERFARGEISEDEFEQRRRVLERDASSGYAS